jgi:hypothetical protein
MLESLLTDLQKALNITEDVSMVSWVLSLVKVPSVTHRRMQRAQQHWLAWTHCRSKWRGQKRMRRQTCCGEGSLKVGIDVPNMELSSHLCTTHLYTQAI